ncbi:hypothetical protein SB48_HM08orf03087 [Heyndrickxia coagulans]|uniref:Uncharacterized protein n=1 Tax=Heyndrickxia coagulans TaxID=1398 RepID=A0AAN0T4R3_HEYCO|nr:hypothetical protein SB48_HM08orf03087 [Heyndrickxia coagulans]
MIHPIFIFSIPFQAKPSSKMRKKRENIQKKADPAQRSAFFWKEK